MARQLFPRSGSVPKALPPLRRKHSSSLDTMPSEVTFEDTTHPKLSFLRARTKPPVQLTPELASRVVKEYLLPMFRDMKQGGSNSEALNPVPGSVYGELRLCSVLAEQVQTLQREVKSLSQQLHECKQTQFLRASQSSHDQYQLHQVQSHFQHTLFSLSQTTRSLQNSHLASSQVTQQLQHYRALAESYETDKKSLLSSLKDTQINIDIRRNSPFPRIFP